MKRRIVSLILALVLVFGLSTTAGAYTDKQMRAADALYHLNLFRGVSTTAKVYMLDNALTRMEGTVLLVRMLGKEAEANRVSETENPFTDLNSGGLEYGIKSVTYAKQQGLVNGTTATTFDPRAQMSDFMFLTLVLRSLGYKDGNKAAEGVDFVWNAPYELAKKVGLISDTTPDAEFTRGDAVLIFWNAMKANFKGSVKTLTDNLIAANVFTGVAFTQANEIWTYGYILHPADDDNSNVGGGTNVGGGDSTDNNQNTGDGSSDTTVPDGGSTTEPDDDTTSGDAELTEYEKYLAMTPAEQQAYMESFGSVADFIAWFNAAKAEYEASQDKIEVGGDGTLDLGDIVNGQN